MTTLDQEDVYTSCRMYEKDYPDTHELVMVTVNRVTEIGVYATLLEYNNKEGFILLSNLSRKRIRSVNKHVRIGRQEVLQVLRVDQDKGYIDLSKKLIQKEDVVICQERFKKSKQVHSIMQRVAHISHIPLEEVYQKIGWPLYRQYTHAFDALKLIVNDSSIISLDNVQLKEEFLKTLKQRMIVNPVRVQADIEVTCYSFLGINAIKQALHAGVDCGTPNEPIIIQLVTTPHYMIFSTVNIKENGIDLLNNAIHAISQTIIKHDGTCTIKFAPRVVSS